MVAVKKYVPYVKKWVLIVLAFFLLGGGFGYLTSSRWPSSYRAQMTFLIGNYMNDPNPSVMSIYTGRWLIDTYIYWVRSDEVLQDALLESDLNIGLAELRGMLSASPSSEDMPIFTITAKNDNPDLCVQALEAIAEQLQKRGAGKLSSEEEGRITLIEDELENLQNRVIELRIELNQIEDQMLLAKQGELEALQEQRNTVSKRINLALSSIAQFNYTLATINNRTNTLTVIDETPALLVPGGTNAARRVAFGAAAGAAGSIALAVLVEYMNRKIRSREELSELAKAPLLGAIAKYGDKKSGEAGRLITSLDQSSPISEAYRAIRTNLIFSRDFTGQSYIVTSPGPAEGKTTTVANLAAVMAMFGLRVLLVDADLRRPTLHKLFGLRNATGLTTLLGAQPPDSVFESLDDLPADIAGLFQQTPIANLWLLASGSPILNPSEVLGSSVMLRWANLLDDVFDVLLFDTPPSLVVSDSYTLSATLGAPLILVARANKTRPGDILKTNSLFRQLDLEVVGSILNFASADELGYGYGASYYYYAQDAGATVQQQESLSGVDADNE